MVPLHLAEESDLEVSYMVWTFHVTRRIVVFGHRRLSFSLRSSFRLSSGVVILPLKWFGWRGSAWGLMRIVLLIVVSVTVCFFYVVALLASFPTAKPGGPVCWLSSGPSPETNLEWLNLPGVIDSPQYSSQGHRSTQASPPI